MALERYSSDLLVQGGKILGTNGSIQRIRDAVKNGEISTSIVVIQDGDRLDAIAGRVYGDGRLWWVIAAASNIGWWLQVPPGTRIVIPNDLSQVESYI
jgi:nucleoid-associated protein YgaU